MQPSSHLRLPAPSSVTYLIVQPWFLIYSTCLPSPCYLYMWSAAPFVLVFSCRAHLCSQCLFAWAWLLFWVLCRASEVILINLLQACKLWPPSGVIFSLMFSRTLPGAAGELKLQTVYIIKPVKTRSGKWERGPISSIFLGMRHGLLQRLPHSCPIRWNPLSLNLLVSFKRFPARQESRRVKLFYLSVIGCWSQQLAHSDGVREAGAALTLRTRAVIPHSGGMPN